jgi:protein-disulfide isomerase
MGKKHRHGSHDHTQHSDAKVSHISRSQPAAKDSGPWLGVAVVLGLLLIGSLLTGGYGDWGLLTGLVAGPFGGGDQRSSAEFNLDGAYAKGARDAQVTIIEYSDFECPFCARFYSDTLSQIERDYISTGKVQFVYKHFPLSFHQNAQLAAEASECAGDQGSFFDYHDALYENQARWSALGDATEQFVTYAQNLGLDSDDFRSCLTSGTHSEKVQADFQEGSQRGVRGTPAFFIDGQLISGAQPYAVFREAIEAALAGEAPALEPEPEPTNDVIELSRDDVTGFALGSDDAEVVILEWSSYHCPFCGRHHTQTMPLIEENYIQTGQVQLIYHDFDFQPKSKIAATAARCAAEQTEYFDYQKILYENQAEWSPLSTEATKAAFIGYAETLGINTEAFEECYDSDRYADEIAAESALGRSAGVSGTPAFLIGTFEDGFIPVVGAQPYAAFEQVIEAVRSGEAFEAAAAAPAPEPSAPERVQLSRDEVPGFALGSDDAQVFVLEWSSYHCPFCGRHHTQTMPLIEENYIQTGQVQLIYHDFDFQPKSKIAATAARCAAEQTEYFDYQKILYENQAEWSPLGATETREAYIGYAEQLGIDTEAFAECYDSDRYSDEIAAESALGRSAGVSGTPAFLIGNFEEGFVPVVGAQPYAAFEQVIEAELA